MKARRVTAIAAHREAERRPQPDTAIGRSLWPLQARGLLWFTASGGRSWTRGESCGTGRCGAPGSGYPGEIAATDAGTVYLAGNRSPPLVTHDGGAHWTAVHPVIGNDTPDSRFPPLHS